MSNQAVVLDKAVVLEKAATQWQTQVSSLAIVDQVTYDRAVEALLHIADLWKQIEDHHRPIIDAAFRAHKAAVAGEKRLLAPLTQARDELRSRIAVWNRDQEVFRQQEQARLFEEAKKQQQEMQIAAAIEAETMGAPSNVVEAILDIVEDPLPIVAPPTYQKAPGISHQERWRAEVTDLAALIVAAAAGKAPRGALIPDMTVLNQLARAMKQALNIPGVKAVPISVVTARR